MSLSDDTKRKRKAEWLKELDVEVLFYSIATSEDSLQYYPNISSNYIIMNLYRNTYNPPVKVT